MFSNDPRCRGQDGPCIVAQAAPQPSAQFRGFLCLITVAERKSFRGEADRVQAVCLAERRELETRTVATPATPTGPCWAFGEYQLDEIAVGADGWQPLSVAIDSGAAETVIPHRWASTPSGTPRRLAMGSAMRQPRGSPSQIWENNVFCSSRMRARCEE